MQTFTQKIINLTRITAAAFLLLCSAAAFSQAPVALPGNATIETVVNTPAVGSTTTLGGGGTVSAVTVNGQAIQGVVAVTNAAGATTFIGTTTGIAGVVGSVAVVGGTIAGMTVGTAISLGLVGGVLIATISEPVEVNGNIPDFPNPPTPPVTTTTTTTVPSIPPTTPPTTTTTTTGI